MCTDLIAGQVSWDGHHMGENVGHISSLIRLPGRDSGMPLFQNYPSKCTSILKQTDDIAEIYESTQTHQNRLSPSETTPYILRKSPPKCDHLVLRNLSVLSKTNPT